MAPGRDEAQAPPAVISVDARLRDCVGSVASSLSSSEQACKVRLLSACVARGKAGVRSLLSRKREANGARAARCDDFLRDLIADCERLEGVRLASHNRAHHVASVARLLASIDWAAQFKPPSFAAGALNGFAAGACEAFDVALACGDVRWWLAAARRARERCHALGRATSSAADLSPRSPLDAAARPLLSNWLALDVFFEASRMASSERSGAARAVRSLSSFLSLLRDLSFLCRYRLARVLGVAAPASLPLDPLTVITDRAAAMLAGAADVRTLLDGWLGAAQRSFAFWSLTLTPHHQSQHLRDLLSHFDAQLAAQVSSRVGDEAEARTRSFNVVCANVGTARNLARVADLFQLAEQTHASIVLLQETRIPSHSQIPALPAGWTAFVAGRAQASHAGGGVAVVVRQPALAASSERIGNVGDGVEVLWVRVRVNAARAEWLHVASIYVPPNSYGDAAARQAFLRKADAFVEQLRELLVRGEYVIVAGDFNAQLRSRVASVNLRDVFLQRVVCDAGLCVANAFDGCSVGAGIAMNAQRARLLTPPVPEQLDALAAECPPTHVHTGIRDGAAERHPTAKLDWILVSPNIASCIRTFGAHMLTDVGHAALTLRTHFDSLTERFQSKQRPRLRVELLSRHHLSQKQAAIAADMAEQADALPPRSRAEAGTNAFAEPLTILLRAQVEQRIVEAQANDQSAASAVDVHDAYARFCAAVQEPAKEILTPLAQRFDSTRATRSAGGSDVLPNGVRFVWWEKVLKELRDEKMRAGRSYAKQLRKNDQLKMRGEVVSDSALARTEELRRALRELERRFSERVSETRKRSFANLLQRFDEALNVDRLFPMALWSMLRGVQKRKASPNGTDSLIAVAPAAALAFWREVWADRVCDDERQLVESIYAELAVMESVRQSLSPWIGSPSERFYDELTRPIAAGEVAAQAKLLSRGKAPGFDELSNDVLRVLPDAAFEEFAVVCNRAIAERELPAAWLRGSLKLLPKPNTAGTQPGDYRPICLLSCAFKLFECVLMERFKVWIDRHDRASAVPFLSAVQGGFRAKRGTLDQVLHLLLVQQKYVAQLLSERERETHSGAGVLAVFLDITKAFDSVPHGILLQKLLRKGVPVPFVRMIELLLRKHWCELDFTHANFEVAVAEAGSGEREPSQWSIQNSKGAIQGSISGPLMWDVFIDDLIELLERRDGVATAAARLRAASKDVSCDVVVDTEPATAVTGAAASRNELSGPLGAQALPPRGVALPGESEQVLSSSWFADDASLLEHSCDAMQAQLDVCTAWAERNRIAFSPKKSVAMWLVKPSVTNSEYVRVGNERLCLHNALLEFVNVFTYLGVDIVGGGKVTQACSESKVSKCETRTEQLKGMLQGARALSPRLGLSVVRAKLNPLLLYGADVLPPHARADVIQRKALRTITGAYDRVHNWFLYSELGESRISTLAMCAFVNAAARMIASPTPIAACLAELVLDVLKYPLFAKPSTAKSDVTAAAEEAGPASAKTVRASARRAAAAIANAARLEVADDALNTLAANGGGAFGSELGGSSSSSSSSVVSNRPPMLAWQARFLECLRTLLDPGGVKAVAGASVEQSEREQGATLRVSDKLVDSLAWLDEASGGSVSLRDGEQRMQVKAMLEQLMKEARREGSDGLCLRSLFSALCYRRLQLERGERSRDVTARSAQVTEMRLLHKCIKAVSKTLGQIYENQWWRREAESARVPLVRLPPVGGGQPYLCEFSSPHAAVAFLFRTGSFNPPDVVSRNHGELPCALCGEDGGDRPLHLIGLCTGGADAATQAKLLALRARARALFGVNFTDWNEVVHGLVARGRGVKSKDLTRERVLDGCELLHEFYTLRRLAREAAQRRVPR